MHRGRRRKEAGGGAMRHHYNTRTILGQDRDNGERERERERERRYITHNRRQSKTIGGLGKNERDMRPLLNDRMNGTRVVTC